MGIVTSLGLDIRMVCEIHASKSQGVERIPVPSARFDTMCTSCVVGLGGKPGGNILLQSIAILNIC